MACKICGKEPVYDLVCEACGTVAAHLCDGPMCQFDLWRIRTNEPPSCIPLMNGKCGLCGAALHQVLTGSGKKAYRFDNAKRAVFRVGHHSVERYDDGWNEGSQIVRDAKGLLEAWQSRAKEERGEDWQSKEPQDGKCSGQGWNEVDEGMDVAGEIVDVEGNEYRGDCTLWKVSEYGSKKVIGILIAWKEEEKIFSEALAEQAATKVVGGVLKYDDVWSGIRWLVGHPYSKGAGEALMAKADELHRLSNHRWMYVIAAGASASWYASKGFSILAPSACHGQKAGACGCQIMLKEIA